MLNCNFNTAVSREANVYLRTFINKTANNILSLFNKEENVIESLILTGAVAKGEGSVLIEENKVLILSDLDYVIVCRSCKKKKAREGLKRFREVKNGHTTSIFKKVDVDIKIYETLSRIPPIMVNQDLKLTSKVIWGNEKALDLIPTFYAKDIATSDVFRLSFIRAIEHLQLYFNNDLSEEIILYYNVKYILDCITIYLASFGEYTPSYRSRMTKYSKTTEFKIKFLSMDELKIMCDFKLMPTISKIQKFYNKPLKDINQYLWLYGIKVMKECMDNLFHLKFSTNINQDRIYTCLSTKNFLRRLVRWFKFVKNMDFDFKLIKLDKILLSDPDILIFLTALKGLYIFLPKNVIEEDFITEYFPIRCEPDRILESVVEYSIDKMRVRVD